ncbi:general substrate transporter [Hyaloscypha finlandica]|nr:general substrate transporter [Hyaloscypha finlandica]
MRHRLLFGYDQGVFGGLLSNNAFLGTFGNPNNTIQGQIVSTYDIGCILGAISSIFLGDKLGRRRSIISGCCLVIIGGTIQSASYHLPQMIIGRIVAGLGTGMNTTAIPMWQSETSKAKQRGKLIIIQLVLVLGGIVITNWMNFGFTYAPDSQVSWRFPLAFQDFFAILTIIFISFLPESPRWLVMKGRRDEARVIIARLLAKPQDDQQVIDDLSVICDSVARAEEHGNFGWREVFRNGKKQTLRRILLGAGPSFMQQMGGTNVVAYYLPVVLVRSFGFTNRLALILSACHSISLMFWGSMATFLIERVGRKNLMLMGAFTQSICFCMAGMGLSFNTNRGSILAVTFIFLYYVVYGLSFLSIPFMYPSEINSQHMRNTGSSVAMVVNWLFVYVVVLITPDGIANLGWKFYMMFGIINFCFLPIIWYFFVETAGLSLEEIDRLFEIKYDNPDSERDMEKVGGYTAAVEDVTSEGSK